MKRFSLFMLMAFATTFAFSQWTWQNPLPQGNGINSILFTDLLNGYAVGVKGTILKTIDGGITWTDVSCGIIHDFSTVYFTSADTGYIGGGFDNHQTIEGVILKTTDAGLTWTIQKTTDWKPVISLSFPGENTGYAVGALPEYGYVSQGQILKTINGGQTWNVILDTTGYYFRSVFFTDINTGFASTGHSIIKTTDGGSSWTTLPLIDHCSNSLFFLNADTGFAAGSYGLVYKTTDGGLTWTDVADSADKTAYNTIYFPDDNTGYIAGGFWDDYGNTYGRIIKTVDGGNTWTTSADSLPEMLNSICSNESTTLYAAGESGIILKTSNAGAAWNFISENVTVNNLNSVFFSNDQIGYIAGDAGTMLKTTTGGNSWSEVQSGTGNNLESVFFTDLETGYSAGSGGMMIKTTDGGENWTNQLTNTTNSLASVLFTDANTGFTAGENGTIFKTTNAGSTWEPRLSGTGNNLSSICFPGNDTGYISGENGTLLKTADGGDTWMIIPDYTGFNYSSMSFTDADTGYIAGWRNPTLYTVTGCVKKTMDGGNTWTTVLEGEYIFSSLVFKGNTGYVVGEYYLGSQWMGPYRTGIIFKTTNGGADWTELPCKSKLKLNSVFFTDEDNGYIAGEAGCILDTKNGGISGISENGRNGCSLDIFPNPSSGVVTIELSSNPGEICNIDIYKITGELIVSYLNINRCSMQMDISSLPKGIYILKVNTQGRSLYGKLIRK